MNFIQVKISAFLLSLIIASLATVRDVRANISNSSQRCKELLCPAASTSYKSRCSILNDSTVLTAFKDIDLERGN